MDELIQAYKETDYLVPEFDLCIKIDQCSEDLLSFCESRKVESWALITAHNPYSKLLSKEENQKRNEALSADLKAYKYHFALGKGRDTDWPIEDSFFILNITLEQALLLTKKYEQNAMVYGLRQSAAKLILNKDFK